MGRLLLHFSYQWLLKWIHAPEHKILILYIDPGFKQIGVLISAELPRACLRNIQAQRLFFFCSLFSPYVILFFYWRIIALQNFVVFCQTSTWISHRYTYIPSLLNLLPHLLPHLTPLDWYRAPVWVCFGLLNRFFWCVSVIWGIKWMNGNNGSRMHKPRRAPGPWKMNEIESPRGKKNQNWSLKWADCCI